MSIRDCAASLNLLALSEQCLSAALSVIRAVRGMPRLGDTLDKRALNDVRSAGVCVARLLEKIARLGVNVKGAAHAERIIAAFLGGVSAQQTTFRAATTNGDEAMAACAARVDALMDAILAVAAPLPPKHAAAVRSADHAPQ